MISDEQQCVPCPEIISRAVGEVKQDKEGSLIFGQSLNREELSTSWDETGRGNRRHIFGHLMWSPKSITASHGSKMLLRALEDARVNLGLKAIGMQVKVDEAHDYMLKCIRYGKDHTGADFMAENMCIEIATLGTDAELTGEHKYPAVKEAVERVKEFIKIGPKGPITTFFELTDLKNSIAKKYGYEVEFYSEDTHIHPVFVRDSNEMSNMKRHMSMMRKSYQENMIPEKSDDVYPGEMFITKPRLSIKVLSKDNPALSLKKTACEEGCVPVRLDRYMTDQRIFSRKLKRREKATVLVDVSGSMDLNMGEIREIVLKSSALATVAIYSAGLYKGELKIVAAKGKMTDDVQPFGHCNVIDLPALEWLATQPEPRVWISDGAVTGIDDCQTVGMVNACQQVVTDNNIRMVRNVHTAIAALSTKK